MIQSLSIDKLDALHRIMCAMLNEAASANWPELARLDNERRVLLEYSEVQTATKVDVTAEQPEAVNNTPDETKVAQEHDRDPAYETLCKKLKSLDKQINETVENARELLVNETRDHRAQVTAKKGYDQANSIQYATYS